MADGLGAAATALPSGCSFDLTRDASGFQLHGEAPISDEKENPYGRRTASTADRVHDKTLLRSYHFLPALIQDLATAPNLLPYLVSLHKNAHL